MNTIKLALISLLSLLFINSCGVSMEAKKTLGDKDAFSDASNAVNLLPSLNTKCGTASCINY